MDEMKRYDFQLMTDKELMNWKTLALEYQDGKYLKLIKEEIRRRWMYA